MRSFDFDFLKGAFCRVGNLSNRIPVLNGVALQVSGPCLAIMIRCLLVMKAFARRVDAAKRTGGQKWVWGSAVLSSV